ncbi:MAG: hypothetical protein IJH20_06695 [Bacilli bacterium]|nr:hypothetical protein [Bacilli bacterium]
MTNSALYDILVNYIEDNKTNYNIDYKETIETIEELIEEIKKDYKDLEEEK